MSSNVNHKTVLWNILFIDVIIRAKKENYFGIWRFYCQIQTKFQSIDLSHMSI